MTDYISPPIEIDQLDVLQLAYDYIQTYFPDWTPADGNLDVAVLQAIATDAASLRELAASVPDTIFRWYGSTIMQIPPLDAVSAVSTVTFTAQDAAGYTIPAGTQVSIPAAGDTDVLFETLVQAVIPPGSNSISAVGIQAVIPGSAGTAIGSVNEPITLIDALAFITTVTLDAPTTNGQDAEDDETYLNRLVQELQLLSPRLIIPSDFAQDAKNISGVQRALAIDGYNPTHNLLTANDASLETALGNWIASVNVTVAQDATFGVDGTKSLKMTSVAAGDMVAAISAAGQVAVVPGGTYVVLGTVKPAAARTCAVGVAWYTSGSVLISTVYGAGVAVGAGATVALTATLTAPSNAAFARPVLKVQATGAAGEIANWDKMSLRQGTTTDWVAGGTPATGNPRTVAVAAVDSAGNPVSAGIKSQILASAQSKREVNFIVNSVDPNYATIDVTFDVAALPNFDAQTVDDSVTNAITAWLQPYVWGVDPTTVDPASWVETGVLRYNDLVALVRNTGGVAYIKTLTVGFHGSALGTADVILPTPAALTQPGTIAGTAE